MESGDRFFTPETGERVDRSQVFPQSRVSFFHLDEVRWKFCGVYEIGVQSDEEEGERKHGALV